MSQYVVNGLMSWLEHRVWPRLRRFPGERGGGASGPARPQQQDLKSRERL